MRPEGMSQQDLEVRRRTAVKLVLDGGMSRRKAAAVIGVHHSAVARWVRAVEEKGEEALKPIPQKGHKKPRLSPAQKEELRRLLVAGPLACGFPTDLWTRPRVRQLIQERFGVTYHVSYLTRLLRGMGFSRQKPRRRARQQDPEAVAAFREQGWTELKKKPKKKGEPSS